MTWIDTPLLRAAAMPEPQPDDWRARVIRLDRLLDALDAARFSKDDAVREALWAALGGHRSGQGPAATRDALARLFDEALQLDDAVSDEDPRRFVADAIMMLSADLAPPTTADALATRTLAYREVLEHGHARLHDNAAWRLYDHARTTLAHATEVPAGERYGVAMQSQYVERETLPPMDAQPIEGAATLWARATAYLDALADDPRWSEVVALRRAEDAALAQTVLARLPAARDPEWASPSVAEGIGAPGSLAPIVRLADGEILVDAGRPSARAFSVSDPVEPLADRIADLLAQDGRGTVALVLDPGVPAPALAHLFRALRRAQTSRIEIAVRPPADAPTGERVLAFDVARSADAGFSAKAMIGSRLSVHVSGRGPQLFFDDLALDRAPSTAAFAAQVARVREAFPRERRIRMTIAQDAAVEQLVEVLATLSGGDPAAFEAVGWWAGGEPATLAATISTEAEGVLARRIALRWSRPHVDVEDSTAVSTEDDPRVRALARTFFACVPELEGRLPRARLPLTLRFDSGRLATVTVARTVKAPRAQLEAFTTCAEEEALGFRLPGMTEGFDLDLVLSDLP